MVDIVDSDTDERISEQMNKYDSRSKGKLTLSKKLDHSGIGHSKYFKQDLGRQSPTFSPLNSVENKSKYNLLNESSVDRKKQQERSNVQMNQFVSPNETLAHGERYKTRYAFSKQNNMQSNSTKPYEFSPYNNQRGVLRKTRHSLYLNGKQNNLSSFNYTSSGIRYDGHSLLNNEQGYKNPDIPRYPQAETQKQQKQQDTTQLKNKYKQSQKQNEQLKNQIKQLKSQLKQSKDKQLQSQKIFQILRSELGQSNIVSPESISEYIRKGQRGQALITSIMDMKLKITGKSQSNLKDLWRWLKLSIQDLGMKRDIINWIKQDYLKVGNNEPDEMVRLRLMDKGKR